MKNLVIGLGTGRCGTRSLNTFFNEHGISSLHEHYHLPWEPDILLGIDAVTSLFSRAKSETAASVGFYWLNYVDWLTETMPNVKFVCLKREKEKVVKSFMRSINNLSPHFKMWNVIDARMSGKTNIKLSKLYDKSVMDTVNDSTREWLEAEWDQDCYIDQIAESFPEYEGVNDKEVYLNKYWDEYYNKANKYARQPNFLLVELDHGLNTDVGRNKILNFIGCS